MPRGDLITFPPGVLGDGPFRAPIVARGREWIVVDKPAGVAVSPGGVSADSPSLLNALTEALAAGKGQLIELGFEAVEAVYDLDDDVTGAILFATTKAAGGVLRNALGSNALELVYDVVSEERGEGVVEPLIDCSLPLRLREIERRATVSHRGGKKCQTRFTRVQTCRTHSLWEARTTYARAHQIRLHATESGLRIPGESKYGRVRRVFLSDLKRNYRKSAERERPLHAGLAVHLRELRFVDLDGAPVEAVAPRPKSFAAMIRRLMG